MRRRIRGVTFDLWDTIIDDDSDEAKRHARGLPPKSEERRRLVWEALAAERPIDEAAARLAYDVSEAAFNTEWKENSVTWTLDQRLDVLLRGLGRDLAPPRRRRLIDALARMEVDVPPDPIAGIGEALDRLAGHYRLFVVSDAIVTPGVGLRRLLDLHGLEDYFQGFAFSDEVGRSKPHRLMFETAARGLGLGFQEMAHVGDRDHNDVRGAQALGMKAVLFTGKRSVDADGSPADAVCERHVDLPAAIEALDG